VRTEKHRSLLHGTVIGFMGRRGVRDRGKKRANFHMLRESSMRAVLTENLFIDSDADARLLKTMPSSLGSPRRTPAASPMRSGCSAEPAAPSPPAATP
jgi:hypothetical protein